MQNPQQAVEFWIWFQYKFTGIFGYICSSLWALIVLFKMRGSLLFLSSSLIIRVFFLISFFLLEIWWAKTDKLWDSWRSSTLHGLNVLLVRREPTCAFSLFRHGLQNLEPTEREDHLEWKSSHTGQDSCGRKLPLASLRSLQALSAGGFCCHCAAPVIAIGSFVIKQTQPKQKGYCFFYE